MNLADLVIQKVAHAFKAQGFEGADTLVRLSDRPDISDYQSNGALPLAKKMQKNPREIATLIATTLQQDDFFKSISVDGPGFINMRISDTALTQNAYGILASEKAGYKNDNPPKTIVLDYGGPNVAKALHVGHLRSNVIGEALKRLHIFAGDTVIGDVHLGDWGLPMGLLITKIRENQPDLVYFDEAFTGAYPATPPFTKQDLEVLYPAASQQSKIDADFAAAAQENTRLLQNGHRGYRALWQHFVDVSVRDIQAITDSLDVHFDLWYGESRVHDRLQQMIARLKEKGTIIHSENAQVIPLGNAKNGNELPPLIMVKSNGAIMYGGTDLATIEERVETYQPDEILYVVDLRQGLHFEQVFKAADIIGLTQHTTLRHLGNGTINGKDNKPFKTRDGGVMTLQLLIDTAIAAARGKMEESASSQSLSDDEKATISRIVGISALKFSELLNDRAKNYIFDEEKLTSTEGKTGPYILYSIVRMKSILEKMGESPLIDNANQLIITHPAERALLLRLYALPECIKTAIDNNILHGICDYLFKIMQDFNTFYHDCSIKEAAPDIQQSRLLLVKYALSITLKLAHILGLKIPDKM